MSKRSTLLLLFTGLSGILWSCEPAECDSPEAGKIQHQNPAFKEPESLFPRTGTSRDLRCGSSHLELRKCYETIARCADALKRDPRDANVYLELGVAQRRIGWDKAAIESLTEAIRLDPKLAKAYAYRAAAYSAIGEHDLAASDEKKATELGFKEERTRPSD